MEEIKETKERNKEIPVPNSPCDGIQALQPLIPEQQVPLSPFISR